MCFFYVCVVGCLGMVIELNSECVNQLICCSVDWISKFPDECEVLIARSLPNNERQANVVQLSVIENKAIATNENDSKVNQTKESDDDETKSKDDKCATNLQHVSMRPVQTVNKSLQFDEQTVEAWNAIFRYALIHEETMKCVETFDMTSQEISKFDMNINNVYHVSKFYQPLKKMTLNKDYKLTRDELKEMVKIEIVKAFICQVDVMFYVDEVVELKHDPFVQGSWIHKRFVQIFLSL